MDSRPAPGTVTGVSTYADPRQRFSADSLGTVSGPRVVVMCFDRLDRDLAAAADALGTRDLYRVNMALTHAQDLVTELTGMIDLDAWEHASTLAGVYDYLSRLLTAANVGKQISKVEDAQRIVRELGGAFREAARTAVAAPTVEPSVAGGFSAQA